MKKLTTLSIAMALGMALAPAIVNHAFAQTATHSAIVASDHTMRASKLIGMDIFDSKGEKIGKIEDILVKGAMAEPVAVLSVGAFTGGGDKMVSVPISHISLKHDKASMATTKTEMAAMPAWKFEGLEGGGG